MRAPSPPPSFTYNTNNSTSLLRKIKISAQHKTRNKAMIKWLSYYEIPAWLFNCYDFDSASLWHRTTQFAPPPPQLKFI